MHRPFVIYSITVKKLADDIYKFAKESDEIVPSKYADILNANGIEWGYDSMMKADASGLDAQCILALLIASLRAERFCDGALLEFIKNGAVTRWLKRLQELDEA